VVAAPKRSTRVRVTQVERASRRNIRLEPSSYLNFPHLPLPHSDGCHGSCPSPVESSGSPASPCSTVVCMRRTAVALALLIVPVLAFSGCAPTPPPATADPKPSSTPLFANEEEALKAATEAYAAYELALDTALISHDPVALEEVATGKALASAKKSVLEYAQAGKTQSGYSTISNVSAADLGSWVAGVDSDADGQIYACLDVSAVDVSDANGASVVNNEGSRRFPTLVTITSTPAKELLVSEESIWEGRNFCA